MLFQTMNADALYAATTLLFGKEQTEVVAKTYQAFAAAMQNTFNQGYLAGAMEAEERAGVQIDEAFDEGFEQGAKFAQLEAALESEAADADAEQAIDESFDDGYLEGVDDARRLPAFADDRVQQIINDRADEAFESLGVALAEPEDAVDYEDDYCGMCESYCCDCQAQDEA